MKAIKAGLSVLILGLTMMGCGMKHTAVDYGEFHQVKPKQNEAVLCFLRESVIPFQISPTVTVNGLALRKLPNNTYFCAATKAGPQWIEAQWSSLVKDPQNELAIKVKPGEVAYVVLKQIRPQAESLGQAYPSQWYALKTEHAKPLLRRMNQLN